MFVLHVQLEHIQVKEQEVVPNVQVEVIQLEELVNALLVQVSVELMVVFQQQENVMVVKQDINLAVEVVQLVVH